VILFGRSHSFKPRTIGNFAEYGLPQKQKNGEHKNGQYDEKYYHSAKLNILTIRRQSYFTVAGSFFHLWKKSRFRIPGASHYFTSF
jgi:hypothetical protein